MTTESMKALPLGTQVFSVQTHEVFKKVKDEKPDVYRCSFRKVGARGLSSKITKFHGARIGFPIGENKVVLSKYQEVLNSLAPEEVTILRVASGKAKSCSGDFSLVLGLTNKDLIRVDTNLVTGEPVVVLTSLGNQVVATLLHRRRSLNDYAPY